MPRPLLALAALAVAVPLTACGAATTSHPSTPTSVAAHPGSPKTLAPWPTYHRGNDRAGVASASLRTPLHASWTKHLDGGVYGDPLVVGGLVIAATENDSVYALDPGNGHIRWKRHLGTAQPQSGLPCGDIDPLGITGTPAYDAHTHSVFVVAETTGGHHTLWALNASNGHGRFHRSLDVLSNRDRSAEQQRSALLVTHGRVIATFGGLAGDCANYVGYATSVATSGKGHLHHYAVPTSREAGMWSPAGPVTGSNGNVYVASGNGAETNGRWDLSDSVTELTPTTLKRVAVFAPSTWAQDNADDLDLGSSSPVPVGGRTLIAGKRGVVYLVKNSLGGIGNGLKQLSGCKSFGGAARTGSTVVMPCIDGIRELHVTKHSMHWVWRDAGLYGSPTIVGKRIYLADRDSGKLDVLSLATGHVTSSIGVGSLTHFPSEVPDGNRVFVPTLSGITALRGS